MITKSYFEKLEKMYGPLTFGGLFKAWREGEELTQTAFAKKLGLPEIGLIQLALRDSLVKEGFHYEVKLESALV
ncbi:MAG: hypothetical protein J0M15_06410 [Deltaproteobacteria bacterium]|jgi:hypothetical protein|nr:hypothetical protein [Deltaproteobacteria bacterium]